MKNILLKYISIFILVLTSTACSDSYFDVNTPSNTATVEQLRMQDLMAPVIHSTMVGQRSAETVFGNYTQYFTLQNGGAAGQTQASGLWTEIYLYILPNLKAIKEKAVTSNATHIGAISDVLTAINIGIATDTWDNIPYSEASEGPTNNFPAFDTQEEIYTSIFALLDGAILALESEDNSGFTLGSSDLIYNGDTDKWLRAAYTLKARYQLRLMNKGLTSATDVLANIEKGLSSNADNFEMFFNDKNINPYYSAEVLAKNTGNTHNDIASQLVSSMNGDYYPFSNAELKIDPRLPKFADNGGATTWKGYVSGSIGLAPDSTEANTGFAENGYYTSIDSPLPFLTYAEAQFIKAEAAFLANGGTSTSIGSNEDAYAAYLEGVNASLNQFGVDGTTYLEDESIKVGADKLMLNHIMKEKYIANFLNPETFVDFRRYNFSSEVFKGLQIRREEASDEAEFRGQWFRRAEYPASELNSNAANVEANLKTPVDPVWWNN